MKSPPASAEATRVSSLYSRNFARPGAVSQVGRRLYDDFTQAQVLG